MVLSESKPSEILPHFSGEGLPDFEGSFYFNARWYDPNTARFITEDPARDGLLWYAYANNNPMKFTDPTGLRADPGSNTGDDEDSKKADRDDDSKDHESDSAALAAAEEERKRAEEEKRQQKWEEYQKKRFNEKFDNTVFTDENIMNQLDFDVRFDFNDGSARHSKSCQTSAMVNAYIVSSEEGVTGKEIAQAVSAAKEKGGILESDGSPESLNGWSDSIASSLGRESIDPVFNFDKNGRMQKLSIPEAKKSDYSMGIMEKHHDDLPGKIHHTLITRDNNGNINEYDSLDPTRRINNYTPYKVLPLK
jgi:RHS repeat-associated protein